MIIRTAIENDIEDINELFWELDTDAIKYQTEHFLRSKREKEYLHRIINNQQSDFIVAVINNEVIDFSLLIEKEIIGLSLLVPCRYAYIQDFIVKEKNRNCGIGTKLIEASKQWSKNRGLEYLRLSVFPVNDSGIRFYKRHGLKEQMLIMECRLL